jgi:hypothetical protein
MSELKPCPFCGTKSVSFMPELLANQQIYCKFCETSIIFGGTIEWDTKRFNTRPIEDAQSAEIERLKADNARMREALITISYDPIPTNELKTWEHGCEFYRQIAIKALKGEE